MTKGNITVHTENIFPIIKKWLYSDSDIFLRELVSNAVDAITKLKKLADVGLFNAENEKFEISVTLDKENKTLTITDNGIGMTDAEIEKYITQVAFSGAEEFLEKYKDKDDKDKQIIGHFGLGFYSAFMVAKSVEIESLSFKDAAEPAHWDCEGGTEYELSKGTRTVRGTDVILHIEDDELLDEGHILAILKKYCAFLPVPINFGDKQINETLPLWMRKPSDCTEEDYKAFYHNVFHDFSDPLFYIHLNTDFPFNLKGILFFPKVNHEMSQREGEVKLYNNQVFVADNIKEVIPEYLLLLKGVIDCPDLPLNVSRSFLQNDGTVKKISDHIVKKVADKLTSLFDIDRESYNSYWEDINAFVKYGSMQDDKFYEKVKDIIIFKTSFDRYTDMKELLSDEKKELYYATSEVLMSQHLTLFKEQGIEVILLPLMIDVHFISFLEYKNPGVKFQRIDSVAPDSLKGEENDVDKQVLIDKFTAAVEGVKIDAQPLKSTEIPAMLLTSELERRLKQMSALYGSQMGDIKEETTLLLNTNNSLIKELSQKEVDVELYKQVYDLARLADGHMSNEEVSQFVKRSSELLLKSLI